MFHYGSFDIFHPNIISYGRKYSTPKHRFSFVNFYSLNQKQFSKLMHSSDEIMNCALFIFYGFGCTAVRTKTIRMKMWFTWEMKISIKIYFLVILWSVKILEKTFFWNDVFKYAIVVQKLKRWNNVCFWEYQKNDCSLT